MKQRKHNLGQIHVDTIALVAVVAVVGAIGLTQLGEAERQAVEGRTDAASTDSTVPALATNASAMSGSLAKWGRRAADAASELRAASGLSLGSRSPAEVRLRAAFKIRALRYQPEHVPLVHLRGTEEVTTTWRQLGEIRELADSERRFGVLSWLENELDEAANGIARRYELASGSKYLQDFKHEALTKVIAAVFAGKKVDRVVKDLLRKSPPGDGYWNDTDNIQATRAFTAAARRAQNYLDLQLDPSHPARTAPRTGLADQIRTLNVSPNTDFFAQLVEERIVLPSEAAALRGTLANRAKNASSIEHLRTGIRRDLSGGIQPDPLHEQRVLQALVASAFESDAPEVAIDRLHQELGLYRVHRDGSLLDLSADPRHAKLHRVKVLARRELAKALAEARGRI